ncbi:sacsin N-terminal ATP-binding-like domain-containing protein [Streptomyces sp. NPDC101227]|uniref:sacsin N-terminal ATP-binding-like domain-containing protein n=1 Tax=Streptomyces sp. NPDC101227 TaxID=3366136 RepID=UPI0037F69942
MWDAADGNGFREAVIALTRRRIEIYRDAGEVWRFAESLKSVSEDTAQEYEGRTLLELVQNGHDALTAEGPGRIAVLAVSEESGGGVLYVANEGAGFTEENFRAITELALSSKAAGEGIGNKGLGFRSVLQLTDWPEIYSKSSRTSPYLDGYCFRFARPEDVHALVQDPALAARVIEDVSPLALPVPAQATDPVLKELAEDGYSTVIRLPLRDAHAWELAVAQAADMVQGEVPLLLFLDRVAELLVEVRDDSPAGSRRVLSRAEQPSELFEAREKDWVQEVDLAEAGRYLLARRTLDPGALRDAIRRSVRAREIDGAWEHWDTEAWVGVALRLDKPLTQGRMYTFLPMSAAAPAPFPGHAHAPFFTKLARLDISEAVGLNDFLLHQLARLAVELGRRVRAEAPHGTAADLVLDLMCWDPPARLDAALNEGLAAEPIVPLDGGKAWGSLQDAYAWPDGKRSWRVLTTEALTRAGADLLAPSVGPVRHARLDRLCRAVLAKPLRPPALVTAEWVEKVARTLLDGAQATASPRWADFYSDVAWAFGRDPGVLRGRSIILDQDGRLRHALGGSREPGRKDETVFFHPDVESGDAVTRVPGDLKALRRRISFTHPAIPWDGGGREFLERNELVRPYQLDRVFDALHDLLSGRPSDALSRDALTFAFRQFHLLTQAQRRRLSRIAFRLPLATGGWGRATRCSFSPGWGTEGARRLERFLDAGGSRIPALAAQREQWISGPDDWPAAVSDRAAYIEFLEAIGVCDGLRPATVGERLGALNGKDLRPAHLAARFELGDELGAAWAADVRTGWTRFAHPWTPYAFERPPAHLPGATDVAGLGSVARREFAELLMHGLRTWGDDTFAVTVHRPAYTFKDAHTWPTPLASYLRRLPWLPVEDADAGGPNFVTPDRAWISTDGELPAFVPALPLSTRRLLSDTTVATRLRRLGLRGWDDPQYAGAAVKQLADLLDKGDVPEYLRVSFKKHYGRAWSNVAQTGCWPWSPGEKARIVVSRSQALATTVPAADEVTVHVCDEADPLKEALVELAGHPVLVAPPENGEAIARMADVHGLRMARTSVTQVQARHRAGGPITPAGHAAPLVDGREWLVVVVALAVELKSGAFLRRSERGVRALLERLRTVRVVHADDVEIAVSGVPTEPPPTTRALPLPDDAHPTVVVWRCDAGWDELQAATPALAQLLGSPWLQDALELILVKLERHFGSHNPPRIDDATLATALDTTEAKVAEIRRNLTGDVQDTVRLLRPVLACLAGDAWDDDASHVLGRAAGEPELVETVGHYAPHLPIPAADLVALARSSTTPAELRDELGLGFQQFNAALASLGPGYTPYSYPELHEQVFGDFVHARSEVLVDRLRERYAAAAREGHDTSDYVAARSLQGLQPDPGWLTRFVAPPEDVMRARVQEWLRGHGADDDLERPAQLPPVDRLRAHNAASLDAFVSAVGPLVAAWCRGHGVPVPVGWHGAVLLETRSLLEGTGLNDLLQLGEDQLLDAVARAVGWPAGMPHAADPVQLGLTGRDLAREPGWSTGLGGLRGAAPRTITIGDKEVTVGRDQLSTIADVASRTIDESFLAQSGRVRLDAIAGVPSPRRGGASGKARFVVATMKQTSEDQRSAIGLVGEVAALAWLQRRYTEVRWRSGYAALLNEDREASDGLGYDFEVAWRDTTRLFEVKALSDPSADRIEFELGPSEVDAARRHAQGSRYRILLITSALDPEQRRVFELPNPLSTQGRDRFRIVGRGLRYQCSPLGRTKGAKMP